MNNLAKLAAFGLCATVFTPSTTAQEVRVDYPDSVLETPILRFPFYTLGGGGTVRYQTMIPATFAGLPSQPMIATKVGMQIAGQEQYDRFEIRFGTTDQINIQPDWLLNLPNQRMQNDQSGTVLQGGVSGGYPVTQWVEYDLEFPVYWQPGLSLTVDIISSAAIPGSWCETGIGSGERLYQAPYPTAALSVTPDSGIKMRVVFEPVGFPNFGTGCAGTGGFTPDISGTGSSQIGSTLNLDLSNGLGGAPTALVVGGSRSASTLGPLPLAIGGGCQIVASPDLTFGLVAGGTGAGQGTASFPLAIPANPALLEAVLYAQWMQIDAASTAILPVATSDGAAVVIY
ncbi:MAG: hypothetical protein AAF628_05295 [Planctomycetota bacterium]